MSHDEQQRPGPAVPAPTPFVLECPGCRASLAAHAGLAGATASCPACGAGFRVPAATPADAAVVFADPPLPSTRLRPDDAFVFVEPVVAAPAVVPAPAADGEPAIMIRPATRTPKRTRRPWHTILSLVAGAALLVALVVILVTLGR